MAMSVESLAGPLDAEIHGNRQLSIEGAQPVDRAGPHDIAFVADKANLPAMKQRRIGALIVGQTLFNDHAGAIHASAVLVVDDAKWAFSEVLKRLCPAASRPNIGISIDANVGTTARIGLNTNIFAGSTIGENVVIGDHCDIHPGVSIGAGCRLGDNVTLYPNVVLYPRVIIGNRVAIHAASVLGTDGFGYIMREGRYHKIPHVGTVRIEDDVEIGACTTIDRAMIGETVIGEGTKLDNLVMIAHNCRLGKHNAVISQVGFAGSVTTGNYVTCAGQAGITDHVHLGEGCVLGPKAGSTKDIPPGETYLGSPAQPVADAARVLMAQRKLPEMRKRMRELEKQVAQLTAQMQVLAGSASEPSDIAA